MDVIADGRDDDGPPKMLLTDEDNGVDDAPELHLLQQHYIRSIESAVVIRQVPSQGISFQLWPAATTLVTLLDNYRRDPSKSPLSGILPALSSDGTCSSTLNILELGSGTGIVGIAAAAILSAEVTVTDLPYVIDNLRFNADANASMVSRFGGKVHVAPLRWGETSAAEFLRRRFDLILGSDVVYHDHLYDPLLETLRLMLLADDEDDKRMFVMAHVRRWKKDSAFFKKARKFFDVEVIHTDDPLEGSRIGIIVYRFARKHES